MRILRHSKIFLKNDHPSTKNKSCWLESRKKNNLENWLYFCLHWNSKENMPLEGWMWVFTYQTYTNCFRKHIYVCSGNTAWITYTEGSGTFLSSSSNTSKTEGWQTPTRMMANNIWADRYSSLLQAPSY